MKDQTHEHASRLIRTLQDDLSTLRHSTYKTVHDDIGSTISAASIMTKMLGDKVTDSYEKKQLGEIHALIRETMENVSALNKKLKTTWIPQGSDTLFADLKKEFELIETKFGVRIPLEVAEKSKMKKLNYATVSLIHEWARNYIDHALSRLAQTISFIVNIDANKVELQLTDDAPIAFDPVTVSILEPKLKNLQASMRSEKTGSALTISNEGER